MRSRGERLIDGCYSHCSQWTGIEIAFSLPSESISQEDEDHHHQNTCRRNNLIFTTFNSTVWAYTLFDDPRGTVGGTLVSCDAFQSIILKVTEEFRIEEGRESGSLRTIMLPLDNIWLLATDGPPSLTG